MKRFLWLTPILLWSCLASAALPALVDEEFYDETPAAAPSGPFTLIASDGAKGTGTANVGPLLDTGATVYTVSGRSDSGTMTMSDTSGNTFIAGIPKWTGSGTGTNQQFYCISPTILGANIFSISSSDGPSTVALVVRVWSSSGTPSLVSQSGTGSGTGTTIQPGSLGPPSATNLFVGSVGGSTATPLSVDSSFSTPIIPSAGIMADAWKLSATAENPTWTVDSSDHLASTMMMFAPSGGGVCTPSYANTGGTGNRTGIITITINPATGPALIANPTLLLDGVTTSGNTFAQGSSGAGDYIRFDFGSAVTINEIKWYQSSSATDGTWKVQGSNDGSTFTDIGSSFTLGGSGTQTITAISANTTSYRYYQLIDVSGTLDGSTFFWETEFKICQ